MVELPDSHRDFIEKPITPTMISLLPDGTAHATIVWWRYKDSYFYVSMWTGSQKYKDLRRDPRVTFLSLDPTDAGRYLEVRGKVVEFTYDYEEWIEEACQFFTGNKYYGGEVPEADRADPLAIAKIEPLRIRTVGS
jgi:Pyridoxamine 5'-phosphate oxidase